ncbi:MAG: FKBP-type peptidyl-prolyl cis-trans isomerase [Bacteroidota bacterium]
MKHHTLLLSLLLCGLGQWAAAQFSDDPLASYLKDQQIEAQATPEGLYYRIDEAGSGPPPQAGDYVQVRYVGRLLDGRVFDRSKAGEPLVFQLGRRQVIQGWELGLPHFTKGGRGQLFLPAQLAYGRRGAGKVVPPNSPLVFDIEVLDIMDLDAYDRYMEAREAVEKERYERAQAEQFAIDQDLLRGYLDEKRLKAKRTASGLYYAITKKGKGKTTARVGDEVEVQYEGYLLNGDAFDTSGIEAPYRFTLGEGKVITGWEEGLTYFKKGGEGWLLVPSKLAYGPRSIEEADVYVPANSILIFKIRVTDVSVKS